MSVSTPLNDENHLVWLGLHILSVPLTYTMLPLLEAHFGSGKVPSSYWAKESKTCLDVYQILVHLAEKRSPRLKSTVPSEELAKVATDVRYARNMVHHGGYLDTKRAAKSLNNMAKICEAVADSDAARRIRQLETAVLDPNRVIRIENRGTSQEAYISTRITMGARKSHLDLADELVQAFSGSWEYTGIEEGCAPDRASNRSFSERTRAGRPQLGKHVEGPGYSYYINERSCGLPKGESVVEISIGVLYRDAFCSYYE